MQDKFAEYEDKRDPAVVLFDMAKNHGWSDEDIVLLSKLTEDDLYKMFKTLRGLELRSVIRKALELEKQCQAGDERYVAIGKNTLSALQRLAKESAVNAQRVSGLYNIAVPDDLQEDQPIEPQAAG